MSRADEFTKSVDIIVGARIMEARQAMGFSGHQLAKKIGVTYQQLHKYEKGTNRITIARIALIAATLERPITYFFDGWVDSEIVPDYQQRLCLEMQRNFLKIQNPLMREAINNLAKIAGRAA